ncbi:DegT/DnrJ/EryC1/StrS family aminotransferase [candidate division KSB1 bacterium]|nr:DegT/DnrJ/EryC1/StrS family aminotransferase [candidate division KSB1 bacterium]
MPQKTSDSSIPVFVQTVMPEKTKLDRWQQVTEDEARLAYDMTLRNELSGGTPVVREFEAKWREVTGLTYAITTMNGSTALYSAYFGLGVGPGDEVICPTYTWICTISPAVFLGARPVFVESDPETLLLDPEDLRRKITDKTRAIVVVHLWGNICDMDRLLAISRETGVPIVEDCSHAHGARYRDKPIGSLGHVGAWSLQGSKAVSAGEGGILATNDAEIFERACLAGQANRMGGLDLHTPKYADLQPLGLGMKFRAHPLGIGIANVQLAKLDALNARRKAYVETVEARLRQLPGVSPLKVYDNAERGGYYGFPIIHHPEQHGGLPTEKFIEMLRAEGLDASVSGYGLLHRLKIFAEGFDIFTRNRGPLCGDYAGYREGDFPVTEDVHKRLIFLPMLSDPAPNAVENVLSMIERAVERARKG